jgi:membrane dipeptidase
MVSHTGPAGRRPDSRRHLADGCLRDVADAGGVIGLWPLARPPLGLDAVLDDVEYACRLVGVDHVGIGTDMAGLRTATALPSYREFPALRAGLAARGLATADLQRLLGGNLMRLFGEVAGGR